MRDTKIYLITCREDILDKRGLPTGKKRTVVSHGIGNNTLHNIILSQDPPETYPIKRDEEGIYIDA
jgi:hypothetical protein